ncbi:MAG: hypothetical protein MUC50_11800 [Myxococcota bacterium]|jgi:ATP-dependent exoDNAse (exonuclease V) alpha subunit|nr:hypothetical protein [Myxococcota bacterium]
MNPSDTFQILQDWCGLLDRLSAIELDVDLEPTVIEEKLAQRQKTIEHIQTLDAPLLLIAADRAKSWPTLEESQRPAAEALVQKGRSMLVAIMEADRVTIEKAKEKRTDLLDKLKSVSVGKTYASSSHTPTYRPPVIVDKNA